MERRRTGSSQWAMAVAASSSSTLMCHARKGERPGNRTSIGGPGLLPTPRQRRLEEHVRNGRHWCARTGAAVAHSVPARGRRETQSG
jgi:hypothetical protein